MCQGTPVPAIPRSSTRGRVHSTLPAHPQKRGLCKTSRCPHHSSASWGLLAPSLGTAVAWVLGKPERPRSSSGTNETDSSPAGCHPFSHVGTLPSRHLYPSPAATDESTRLVSIQVLVFLHCVSLGQLPPLSASGSKSLKWMSSQYLRIQGGHLGGKCQEMALESLIKAEASVSSSTTWDNDYPSPGVCED